MKIQQRYAKPLLWISALLITALVTGCGGGKDPILGTPEVEVGPLAPTVTAVAPANNASSVAINIKKITATFSKAMDPATLTAASFTLACPVGTPKTGVVTYSESSNVATLTLPAVNLPSNTECTATISTAAKDTAGVALAAPFNWSFTTGLTADTTAPFVIATGVYGNTGTKSGAINQPINRDSTATFSEAMDPETICGPANTTAACPSATYTLVKTSDGTPVPGVVSYIGNTATFNPNSNLAANTTFTSTVTTGAKDLAGNAVATSYIWTWATAAAQDTTAPTISLTNPVHLATNVAINKVINTTFSEEMKQSTIIAANYTVKETVTSINVPGTVTYNVLNHIANFSPQSNLKADTDYTVTVSNKATDLANNALIVPAVGGLPK
ncbi:MAG: Ig-like domain-containing protein, partial [Burkholderiaceae bacterium]